MKRYILICLSILCLIGCNVREKKNTQVKKIFSFPIGYDKEELGLLPEKSVSEAALDFCYNNGFFYISDKINNKILKVTETGVVVLIIYNQSNYPHLVPNSSDALDVDSTSDENYEYLKLYSSYSLEQPGAITADIEKNIYVVNREPMHKKYGEQNQIEDEFILKFDSRGRLIYKIGKNGSSKSVAEVEPFNYISKVATDINNNLIVMEGYSEDLKIYKYSKDGELLYQTLLSKNKLPLSKNELNGVILLIDVIPGYSEDEILANYQFISREISNSIELFQLEYEKIFRYNIKEDKFDKMLLKTSPEYEDLSKLKFDPAVMELYGDMKKIQRPMPTFIGCDSYSNIYLYQEKLPLDSLIIKDFRLMKYNENGRIESLRHVRYSHDIVYNSDMYLTHNGRVLSYVVKENEVTFVSVNE
ncbi:MAG: hypothetical protein J6B11_00450 [Spirochaetales bacterium]|nr:hypothetical protein [Spirochaetales bacterium]